MDKISLAVLTPDYYPDFFAGIGVHAYSLVTSLKSIFDIDITVFVLRCEHLIDKEPLVYEAPAGVTVYEFTSKKQQPTPEIDYLSFKWTRNNIVAVEFLGNKLKDFDFDILHCHDMFPVWIMDFFKRKLQIPVVATVHGREFDENKIEDALRGFVCRASDICIAVSNSLADELQDRYGANNIKVVYNGVSSSKHSIGSTSKEDYITYCGRLDKLKGVHVLINAFCELLKYNENLRHIKLIIMGDGTRMGECILLADSLGISSNVRFTGKIPNEQAREIISKSLVHVVPSFYEPFATSALEAMEEGTFVIASAIGGLKEMIDNNQTGLLIEPGDVNALMESIKKVLTDDAFRKSTEIDAKKAVRQFRWEIISKQIMNVYLGLMADTAK